jgi:methyl-accepting chemotaxis protein
MGTMKVSTRLGLGFGAVLLLLGLIAFVSWFNIRLLGNDLEVITDDLFPKIVEANGIIDSVNEIARALRNAILLDDPEQIRRELDRIPEIRQTITRHVEQLTATITSPGGIERLNALRDVRARFIDGQDRLITLTRAGRDEEARAYLFSDYRSLQQAYFASIEQVIRFQTDLMDQTVRLGR